MIDVVSLRKRLKAALQAALATRGIEVHRTAAGVRRTLPAVLAHYRALGLEPSTVIDVGVGPGTPDLYQAFPEATLVLVEPLEEWRADLQRWQLTRPVEIVSAAAGAESGEIEIAVHRVATLSSIVGSRPGDAGHTVRRTVPMVRVDDVIAERALRPPFVLKVDVEGAELEVLGGALEVLHASELVLLEVSLFELVDGAPLFHDVVAWMHEHGFVIADVYNGHNRPLDGALAQLDVAFVHEHGQFRTEQAYATPDQADALYRSWGR